MAKISIECDRNALFRLKKLCFPGIKKRNNLLI